MRIRSFVTLVILGWAPCLIGQIAAPWVPLQGQQLWVRADVGVIRGVSQLVSCWKDQSGQGHDLLSSDGGASPRWQEVDLGGMPSLDFDGDDVLSRGDGMPTGDYTKLAVVSLDQYGLNNNVLSGGSYHALWFNTSDRARMYHGGTFVTSSVPTALGQPTVLIATYDASSGVGMLYQDGVPVGSGSAAPNTDTVLELGGFGSGNHLDGSIAEAMVYDRVLNQAEISVLFAGLARRYQRAGTLPLTLTQAPRDGELLQRDGGGQASVLVAGTVDGSRYRSVELDVLADGVIVETLTQPLTYVGSPAIPGKPPLASFSFAPRISAGLVSYDFELRLLDGPLRTLAVTRRNVLCGDTFLVSGQSNAVASDYHGEGLANQSQSVWIRTFGSSTASTAVASDQHWDLADGLVFQGHAAVGGWALRMAEQLVVGSGIPVGLLNGAVSGTSITLHQRNDADPTDLTTIYGRLLNRAQTAGLTSPRALLWYQGESDGENAALWQQNFDALHDDWLLDFPALEQLYVFQIRLGCGVTFEGVREVQRQLPAVHPDVTVMSTTAAPGHDGCHFFYTGYRELGERMARVLARDMYGSRDTQDIDPPDVASARFVGASGDQLELTFVDPDDTLLWDAGNEQFFQLDDGTAVLSGAVSGNRLTLSLAGPSTAATVTYFGHSGDGPWLTNARGVGALTFFDVPIQ